VIVDDLDVVRVAVEPAKTNTPLVVDTNAVLSRTITGQFFQAVPRWNAQIGKRLGGVENQQLPQGRSLNRLRKFGASFPTKHALGLTIAKAADHSNK
jgi:hypothetical protein